MSDSLQALWMVVANDLAARCHIESTDCEEKTLAVRLEHEGDSFLTITLPAFGKDFEKALSQLLVSPDLFRGFRRAKGMRVPEFLGGFLARVFDCSSGLLLDEPDIDAIFAIRQLTLMYAKLLLPCSEARVEKAMSDYIECEKEVRRSDANLSVERLQDFKKASLVLWGTVLQQVDEDVYNCRIIPKHGPGATADRLQGNRKFNQLEWTERLERVFPFGEYALANWGFHSEFLSRFNFLEPGSERPVRVISVPKTLKAPRIIAVEPTCMQYVQQGLLRSFVENIESSTIRYPSNRNVGFGVVGFTSQEPNQLLARRGSLLGDLATLDLSEASDRVSNQLVRTMTENFPNLHEGLDACRSRSADVPGHGVIRLAKFASMGSAVTFPVEAMVFSTIAFVGIARQLNEPVSEKLVNKFRTTVRVYGDDIIVPVRFVEAVIDELESFGMKVNRTKSFWTGKFRESCGKEFYDGSDVSIVRLRRKIPTMLRHVEEIISLVSTRNQFYTAGLWGVCKYLDDILESVLVHYPVVGEDSPVLGRVSFLGYETQKIDRFLHSPLVKGYRVVSKIPVNRINGHSALMKCLLKQGEEPFADSRHLQRSGRPDAVRIKLGWTTPF